MGCVTDEIVDSRCLIFGVVRLCLSPSSTLAARPNPNLLYTFNPDLERVGAGHTHLPLRTLTKIIMKPRRPKPISSSDSVLDPSIDPEILANITPEQWTAIEKYVFNAKGKKQPKLVDIRFVIDLVLTRFYIVLLVGKDRRTQARSYPLSKLIKLGNIVAAVILLLGVNLMISACIVLVLYLIKSAFGYDFLSGHISESLGSWMK
jgi:hypothetical protein